MLVCLDDGIWRTQTPMNTTRICLSRHGETDWNRQGILQGWLDVPINTHGRLQAFADRVLRAMTDIGAGHPGQRVLVVTHGWVLDVVSRHINGLPRQAVLAVKPKNGESVCLCVDGAAIQACAMTDEF